MRYHCRASNTLSLDETFTRQYKNGEKGDPIMRNVLFGMVALWILSGCGMSEESASETCLEGETEEQCLERTMPETSSGDSD